MAQDIAALTAAIQHFARERDWEQFNTPKNLACALTVEAGELLEHFQWLTDEQSRTMPPDKLEAVAHECADVFIYLMNLAATLGIDLAEAAQRKLAINALKYPVDKARGSARKYTEL